MNFCDGQEMSLRSASRIWLDWTYCHIVSVEFLTENFRESRLEIYTQYSNHLYFLNLPDLEVVSNCVIYRVQTTDFNNHGVKRAGIRFSL